MKNEFSVKVYSDGAEINAMRKMAQNDYLTGFTTNPSLMKRAGITNYLKFAHEVVSEFPNYCISFEVFSQDPVTMKEEALTLSSLSKNVYVKIPILNLNGNYNTGLISDLSDSGVKVNVTAITTDHQVAEALTAVNSTTPAIVSLFVGRVADTGRDPKNFVDRSVELCSDYPNVETLWASTREVYNIYQAEKAGIDIITVPPKILEKYNARRSFTPDAVAMDTVRGFDNDIKSLGFSILDEKEAMTV
ncbi:MAG TPA: transaldolase [Candidatus Limosilactobacillus merdigallinarum]|uniref:Transaldolase n=1 Tax=Candidatus Limosilactobacillus merdigallinarum TaxID=2838652 RepID=A0A9D2AJW2_9LACO|nr:transaldolase [Candidatus Limosilactobacillus merdigallinarum]